MIKVKYFVSVIIILLVITAGIYYYYSNNHNELIMKLMRSNNEIANLKEQIKQKEVNIVSLSKDLEMLRANIADYESVEKKIKDSYDMQLTKYRKSLNILMQKEAKNQARINDYKLQVAKCNNTLEEANKVIQAKEHKIKLVIQENEVLFNMVKEQDKNIQLQKEIIGKQESILQTLTKSKSNSKMHRNIILSVGIGAFVLGGLVL